MMARSHALLGAAGWLAAAPVVTDAVHQSLDLPTLAASTLVCAGAALLPDLDHHDGLIANSLGPATRLLARGVAAVSGGHRHATHSLVFAAVAGWVTWALLHWLGRPPQLVVSLLCAGFALRAMHLTEPLHERRLHWSAIALAAGAITWAEAIYVPGPWRWLPIAVAVGCLLHLVGDVLTPEGVPLLWPWNERMSIPVLDHTNDWTETFVVVPVLGLVIFGLAWVHFAAVRTAALTWLDGLAR